MILENLLEENSCLPTDATGQIISPRYLPANSPTLDRWRAYLKETPEHRQPPWLRQDLEAMRLGRRT